jgi:hypothetical protein
MSAASSLLSRYDPSHVELSINFQASLTSTLKEAYTHVTPQAVCGGTSLYTLYNEAFGRKLEGCVRDGN